MSDKHKDQILDTMSGLVSDLKPTIEKAFQNLTRIVLDFNHDRIIKAIESKKGKESQKPSEIIIDIKEIGEHEKR